MADAKDEAKGLDHYLANPGEFDPTDTKLAMRLLAESDEPAPTDKGTSGDEDDKAAAEAKAKADTEAAAKKAADDAVAVEAKAKTDAEAKAKEADKSGAATTDEPKDGVILTKDGKNTIPFSVLESTRAKVTEANTARERAEAALATANAEAEAMRAKLAVQTKATGADKVATSLAELDAQIAELEGSETPWLAKTLKATRDALALSEERFQSMNAELEKARVAAVQASQTNDLAEVRTAIDNNPALMHWEASNPAAWKEALEQDNRLLKDPAWATKSFAERFNKVVEIVTARFGKDILPATTAAAPSAAEVAALAAKTKEVAAAKLKDAGSAVTTLSDIPGGAAVEASAIDTADKQSTSQLGNMFMNMSPEKQRAWLAANT